MNKPGQARLILLLLLLPCTLMKAQEVELPLSGNPLAKSYYLEHPAKKSTAAEASLELPVVDDFSGSLVAPDPLIWIDQHVFINRSYGVDPITIGVATLDAVDGDGSVYPGATIDPDTYIADRLTSQPVNLALLPADSVYLSFYYQPAGLGEEPEAQDSLCVDFYDPALQMWTNVWHIPGTALSPFKLVMLPVTEERFLVDGFRFRFRNLASQPYNSDYFDLRSNVDHWNIDYVVLDKGRSWKDTIFNDVAFTAPLNSMVSGNQEIPWSHFEAAYISANTGYSILQYRNNDDITRNVTRSLQITDLISGFSYSPGAATSKDIAAFDTASYKIGYVYPFDFGYGDSALFELKAWMRTDIFDLKTNDTIIRIQKFGDYYANDDGSAEAGYGLRGQNTSSAKVAVKFKSYIRDKIGGVDIYFNQTMDSVNLDYYFKLEVWGDNEGVPGAAIYIDENDYTPQYSSGLNRFIRYEFAEPVEVQGTFYVGWMQYNKYLLNVGLDKNISPATSKTYYNFTGIWQNSLIPGSLMIRPFLYDPVTDTKEFTGNNEELHAYPNPASDYILLDLPPSAGESPAAELYDISGRRVYSGTLNGKTLALERYSIGIYLLRITGDDSRVYTTKILISR